MGLDAELKRAYELMGPWQGQNNYMDAQTDYIYNTQSVDEIIRRSNGNQRLLSYALHRFYNFYPSIMCEQIFTECDGVTDEPNQKHQSIDFYINGTPFDLKVTIYPKELRYHPYDLTTRYGKNKMIDWMYNNQSRQRRFHLSNRLFIICEGANPQESHKLKSDIDLIKPAIEKYVASCKNGFNHLKLTYRKNNPPIPFEVDSDIIYIKK